MPRDKPVCHCSNHGNPDLHFYGCSYFAPPEADPQMQAENMDYMKLLAIFMWKQGMTEVLLTSKDIASMPDDRVVVMGPNPDNQTIRIRLMSHKKAQKERDKLDG